MAETAKDRSNNPYSRYFTKDRSARDLVRKPACEQKGESAMAEMDFRHALNIELLEYCEGYVKGAMDILPGYQNPIGSVHGGVLFTLADSLCGASVLTYGNRAATLNANIDYLKPGLNCTRITGEAQVLKHGRNVTVSECKIYDQNGDLMAVARMDFFDLGVPADYTVMDKYSKMTRIKKDDGKEN